MNFNFKKIGAAALMLVAPGLVNTARAQPVVDLPPSAATPPTFAAAPTPTTTASPSPAPATAPAPAPGAPATRLVRETPIENALDHAAPMEGSAFGGYGELTLNIPGRSLLEPTDHSVVDLRRFVLFFGHNFSEQLRFYSEVEIEHAISSAGDQGEAEVEQAYLDGLLARSLNLRGGLINMPVGIVNVYHEPPTLNGVDRPAVDLYVVPTTWREAGIGIFGELSEGLRYQAYLVNGFNANGFTGAAAIREGHQEAQLASARDWGGVLRLDWQPLLGTVIGLSGYRATSGNTLTDSVGKVPVTLFEADARTCIRGFMLRAQVAFLFVGDTGALNTALMNAVAAGEPPPDPVSAQSRGGYVEVGYDLLRLAAPGSAQSVTLFGRFDYVDTQADVPAGFTANPALRRTIYTAGLVHRPVPGIGLKLDYRRHQFGAGDGHNELASAITWMF